MIAAAAVLVIGVLVFTLLVRKEDLPEPEAESPVKHLEERKATIYENLRDLQFEYRVGKLSDQDYQQTKLDLQKELAAVLAEIDAERGSSPARAEARPPPADAVPTKSGVPAPTARALPREWPSGSGCRARD